MVQSVNVSGQIMFEFWPVVNFWPYLHYYLSDFDNLGVYGKLRSFPTGCYLRMFTLTRRMVTRSTLKIFGKKRDFCKWENVYPVRETSFVMKVAMGFYSFGLITGKLPFTAEQLIHGDQFNVWTLHNRSPRKKIKMEGGCFVSTKKVNLLGTPGT